MQKHCEENQPPEPTGHQKSRSDRDTVEERVNDQSQQNGIAGMCVLEFVVMGLLAEVKMWCDSVFEEMNNQVSEEHQKCSRPSSKFKTLRNHLNNRRGQHESRTQRHEVTQVASFPMPLHDDRSAKNVGGSSRQAKQYAGQDWVHVVSCWIPSINLSAPGARGPTYCLPRMTNVHHISILHDVVLPLKTQGALGAGVGLRSRFEELIPADGFGADEVLFEIGMNRPSRFLRARVNRNLPSATFVLARCEE